MGYTRNKLSKARVPFIKVMKMGGWNDLDTMQIYARVAGVDERGATECLEVLPKVRQEERTVAFLGE
jgi:hypothetical protein